MSSMVVWYQLVDYYHFKEKNEKKKSAEKIVNSVCLCHSHVEYYKNLAVQPVGHCKKFQVEKNENQSFVIHGYCFVHR